MKSSQIYPLLLLAGLMFILGKCQLKNEQNALSKNNQLLPDSSLMAEGLDLVAQNCFPCHSAEGAHADRIAPPMVAVKMHYKDAYETEANFTAKFIDFVLRPDAAKSTMPGAVNKFGLMPPLAFDTSQLHAMAYYVYHTELEKPDWFDAHYQAQRKKYLGNNQRTGNRQRAQTAVQSTQSTLAINLLAAIEKDGPEGAVTFCQTRAYPLTDSMAQSLNVQLKRVSDKPRNPLNQANKAEMSYLSVGHQLLVEGITPSPQFKQENGAFIGYFPIVTNGLCLQCHGSPNQHINSATLARIQQLYPEDKATNYGENQLRGIWVVQITPGSQP